MARSVFGRQRLSRPYTKTVEPVPVARKRIRRTEEQLIQDLQAEIERLKVRAAVNAVKKDPTLKRTSDAVRSIDAALATASNGPHKQALNEARTALVACLQLEGVKLPQRRGRKPGWRKNAELEARDSAAEAG